jgi:hypothetical protein
MNYIKDQDHHWVFYVAFYFLNTSSLCLNAFYIYQKFMSSYTLNFLIAKNIEPKWLNLDVWWFKILVLVELCIRGPIPPSKTSNSKLLQNNLAPLAKMAKYRYLVIWNRGLDGTMRSPTRWGAISTFKASSSKHPRKNLAPWTKMAKFRFLVIWNWSPSGIMRSPTHWGSNSTFKTSNSKHLQKNWLFETKLLNLDVW